MRKQIPSARSVLGSFPGVKCSVSNDDIEVLLESNFILIFAFNQMFTETDLSNIAVYVLMERLTGRRRRLSRTSAIEMDFWSVKTSTNTSNIK